MPSAQAEAARGESIAAGLFVDGVPESLALGLTIAEGELGVALLAGIVIGNVVEAYGAAQPIVAGGHTKRFAITLHGSDRRGPRTRDRARRDRARRRQRRARGHGAGRGRPGRCWR